jgi:hypothetical protein
VSYRWIVGMLVLAVTIGSLISGCGDGDEASADVTKAQFTKEAEAVCAERKEGWAAAIDAYNKELAADDKLEFKEGRMRAEALVKDSLLPILKTELEALEDLDVPEADEAKIDKMLQTRSRGVEELEDKGVEALLKNPYFEAFEKEAKAYGFNCSLE